MNFAGIKALFHKEISDIVRDKKTLFMMVVIPVILYPLLIIGMTLLMSAILNNQMEKTYHVAFVDVPEKEQMLKLLSDDEKKFTYRIEEVEVTNASKALSEGEIDAYVKYKKGSGKETGFVTDQNGVRSLNGTLQIVYYEAKDDSNAAQKALEELLNAYQEGIRKENLVKLALDEEKLLYPLPYTVAGLSSAEETVGNIIGSMVPMMIIVSIMMGAIYPAIDVTAGEKERGTLETLLTLPVTNFEMIMSKFLAVSLMACITAILNIFSMGAACAFMVSFLEEEEASVHLNLLSFAPAALITLIIMLAFSLFVTAISMCVCVFAKSFKEANNYVTPVMLVFMFGGFAGMVPDLELSASTAAIPVINVALLINQLFRFQYDYGLMGIVFVSNVVYSLLTVFILGRIYNSEAILFSEGLSSVKLITKRSEMKKGQMPGGGDVVLLTSVVMLLYLYLGTLLQVKAGIIKGTSMMQILLAALPLFYAWYMKTDFKRLFSVKVPKIKQLIGAFLFWLGGFCINCLLGAVLGLFLKSSAQNVEATFAEIMKEPVWVLILVIAVMPAIAEEMMFRGFIFGTLKGCQSRISAILLTSAIFGIFHMSFIKFFTTAFLGFLLAYTVDRTGCIFCSMLMHFCNNAMSVVLSKYPEKIEQILPFFMSEKLSFAEIGVLVLAGCALLALGRWLITGKAPVDTVIEKTE